MIVLVLAVLALVACGNTEPNTTDPAYGLQSRPVNTTCLVDVVGEATGYGWVPVFTSLSFTAPVLLTFPPDGSNRVAVVEQGGAIRIFANDPSTSEVSTLLSLNVRTGGEEGLLGLAFHPDYATNRLFYVYYTAPDAPRRSIVARYRTRADDPNTADPASREEILVVPQPYGNHNGGHLAFGPDGYLYVALGDGGSGGDPENRAQNTSDLLGSLLRIDVDVPGAGRLYSIPPDNPRPGGADEIYAWGLRNPWRFSFDRVLGTLWLGDVGQEAYEEINVIENGQNYGWRRMEGFACYNPAVDCNTDPSLALPVVTYPHEGGACSVTGGYVYRGNDVPTLQGTYLYGDFCTGTIWGVTYNGGVASTPVILRPAGGNVTSFGEDEAGELYVVHSDGSIHRLASQSTAGGPLNMPALLSDTGCYDSISDASVATGLVPYDVNVSFWSDGTRKRRFAALPETAQFFAPSEGAWSVPAGTILVKEFYLDAASGSARAQPIETRFLIRRDFTTWEGYSYRWNHAGDEATLLDGASTVSDPSGEGLTYTHHFPSRSECGVCHNTTAGGTLGLQTAQLNRDFDYGTTVDNQLRAWSHVGLVAGAVGTGAGATSALTDPNDLRASLEARARSYLHANCAPCHHPGGPTNSTMDLRAFTPLADMDTCNVVPQGGAYGASMPRLIAPGDPDNSVLVRRADTRNTGAMPPLATEQVDDAGIALLNAWITQLSECP